ncbi:MAG: copper chaperone PCu(A)C [Alphaproteobacteria bacterium]
MKKFVPLAFAIAFLAFSPMAHAEEAKAEATPETQTEEVKAEAPVSITDAYAFATAESQKNGAIFATIMNKGEEDAKITAASADVSESVELHTHTMDGDVMQMREVENYEVKAGADITLKPMGHHIMLMGLKEPLKAGESFVASVTLEDGSEIGFPVIVRAPGMVHDDAAEEVSEEEATDEAAPEETHAHEHDH